MGSISTNSRWGRLNVEQIPTGQPRRNSAGILDVDPTHDGALPTSPSRSMEALAKAGGSDTAVRNRVQSTPWTRLMVRSRKLTHQYSDSIRYNLSKVKCLIQGAVTVRTGENAQNAIEIHANEIQFTSTDKQQKTEAIHVIAGQSPDKFTECENMLAQGLESGQGVFQFVSRKAHFSPTKSREKPIIGQLQEQFKRLGQNLKLCDGRYQVLDLKQSPSSESDYSTYVLTAMDCKTGKYLTVPLTQAGLKFTDSVLQANQIERANEIYARHSDFVPNDSTETSAPKAQPLIVSYAGIGRNATLISYRQICTQIETGEVTKVTLDVALEKVILTGRKARGPKFVHSEAQLNALRKALLAKCDAWPSRPPFDAPAPVEVQLASESVSGQIDPKPKPQPRTEVLVNIDRSERKLPPIPTREIDISGGHIEHIHNSCYLASLIHLIANNDQLAILFDPEKHEIKLANGTNANLAERTSSQLKGKEIQRRSGMKQAIEKLRNQGTVTQKDILDMLNFLQLNQLLPPPSTVEQTQDTAEILVTLLTHINPDDELRISSVSKVTAKGKESPTACLDDALINLEIDSSKIASIESALKHYSSLEHLVGENKYALKDESGKITEVNATKKITFEKLPDVLPIALKRHRYTNASARAEKITTKIKAPLVLTIPPECLGEAYKDMTVRYRLVNFTHHTGSYGGGHHVAFAQNKDGKWYKHNDMGCPFVTAIPDNELDAWKDCANVYIYERIKENP